MFFLFYFLAIINFALTVFYIFSGVLPLLWLPYVLIKVIKKEVKPISILNCIMGPIIWNVVFFIVALILFNIPVISSILIKFNHSSFATISCWLGLIVSLLNCFSSNARNEFIQGLDWIEKE